LAFSTAIALASARPDGAHQAMYTQEIDKIAAEPIGAAATGRRGPADSADRWKGTRQGEHELPPARRPAAATMRDAEGLVQIEMVNVCANLPRLGPGGPWR